MDYNGNRRDERFVFKRVTWPEQAEDDEIPQINGGTIESSVFSSIRESGSCTFEGDSPPDDRDLVRIYYTFTADDGETATHALSTMRMSIAEPVYNGNCVSGNIQLYSLLQVLSNKRYGQPFTVQAGTQAVPFAKQLCESLGLKVNATASAYRTSTDHTFKPEDSYLVICNWLMDVAGYAGLDVDAYGVVQMHPYIEPTDRATVFSFVDGANSIFFPEVPVSSNYAETPNVVRLSYETEELSLWAAASNVDQTSRASVVSRNEEITLQESVSELEGQTASEKLANLKELAKRKLYDNSSEIEYTTIEHAWVPIARGSSVLLDYTEARLAKRGSITNQNISLNPSCPTTSKIRRYVHAALASKVEGGILWQA